MLVNGFDQLILTTSLLFDEKRQRDRDKDQDEERKRQIQSKTSGREKSSEACNTLCHYRRRWKPLKTFQKEIGSFQSLDSIFYHPLHFCFPFTVNETWNHSLNYKSLQLFFDQMRVLKVDQFRSLPMIKEFDHSVA